MFGLAQCLWGGAAQGGALALRAVAAVSPEGPCPTLSLCTAAGHSLLLCKICVCLHNVACLITALWAAQARGWSRKQGGAWQWAASWQAQLHCLHQSLAWLWA